MASSLNHFCTPCHEDDISVKAITWCGECEEFLCLDCDKHHGRSKQLKKHRRMTVENFDKLPLSLKSLTNRCAYHEGERFDFFCSFHAAPCCVKCLKENHRECRDLGPLSEVVGNIKTSTAMSNRERELNEVKNNFVTIKQHLTKCTEKFASQTATSISNIQKLRDSINKHLDKTQDQTIQELKSAEEKYRVKIDALVSQIDTSMGIIESAEENLENIKLFATDLQTFEGLRHIEKQTIDGNAYLEKFQENESLSEPNIELIITPAIMRLENDVKCFGEVVINYENKSIKLSKITEEAAQISLSRFKNVNDITISKEKTMNLPTGGQPLCIRGCEILSDGKTLFVDTNNKRLIMHGKDGIYVRDIVKFSGRPVDVSHVKDDIVAVTTWNDHKINFVDISNNYIAKSVQLESYCYGIGINDSRIAVCQHNKKTIVILDLDGNRIKEVSVQTDFVVCLTTFKDMIFYSDFKDHKVVCHSMRGELLWTFSHEALKEPFGISVDMNGIIYVAFRQSNNLLAISADGREQKIVLSQNDGLNKPYALCIHKASKTMLVCNEQGLAFLYKL